MNTQPVCSRGLSADRLPDDGDKPCASIDKIGDAVKEFNIRAKDGSLELLKPLVPRV